MKLIAENKGFKVYFDCDKQVYSVYKDDKFFIGNKYRYIQVKSYLD